jgi:hypothetical protein
MKSATARSILPELVSGRGTTRRVVEGQTRPRRNENPPQHGIRIIEKLDRRNAQRFDSRRPQPFIANRIPLWPIATRMGLPVNFDRQPRVTTEEIQHIRTGWMLATELETFRSLPKPMPQDDFGQRHLATEFARGSRCPQSRFRCDVL